MFKAMKTLYKRIRDFFTGFAIGWKGAEWESMNTRREIENHTPSRRDNSGLVFLFGILLGVSICGNDEDEDA